MMLVLLMKLCKIFCVCMCSETSICRKKGDEGEDEKERKKKEKRQREKPKKDRTVEGNAAEDEWTVVERTKDPHRDMRKALFPNGVENLELPELVKKRGEVMALRGKKVRTYGSLDCVSHQAESLTCVHCFSVHPLSAAVVSRQCNIVHI